MWLLVKYFFLLIVTWCHEMCSDNKLFANTASRWQVIDDFGLRVSSRAHWQTFCEPRSENRRTILLRCFDGQRFSSRQFWDVYTFHQCLWTVTRLRFVSHLFDEYMLLLLLTMMMTMRYWLVIEYSRSRLLVTCLQLQQLLQASGA